MQWLNVISDICTFLLLIILIIAGVLYATGNVVYINKESQDEYRFIQQVAQKFQESHTYTNGSYNCQNYSNDFAYILQNLGFETFVYWNMQEHHAYNLIAIEPQTGKIRRVTVSKNKKMPCMGFN